MRASPVVGLALVAALALTSCADAPAAEAPAPSRSATPSSGVRPAVAQLMHGFWRVRDASGEPADSWLRLTPLSVTLFRPGGRIDGALAVEGDHLLADRSSWSTSLGDGHEAPWLAATDRVERDGDAWLLLDAAGGRVARLVRDGRPARSARYETEPNGLDGSPTRLRTAAPGPGVVDAPAAVLTGSWHLAGHREAAVAFRDDGRWISRTSCESGTGANGGGGRWRVLPEGLLLVTEQATTAMGCYEPVDPAPADASAVSRAGEARSFRVDGDRLTLFDAAGARIGSLVR